MNLLVVVPVLGRPEHPAPFMESLADVAPVLAVATQADHEAITAWESAGARVEVVPKSLTSFPHKAQLAYEWTTHDWLLLVGSDVSFHPGWLDAAEVAMKDGSVGLIATNDMANPYVLAGEHATHPIIRRAYVDDRGACWDGPGWIVHTGYRHAYCDSEWSTKANQDGVFRYVPECKIEHLHPTWGKGHADPVYALGMKTYVHDGRLFEIRREKYAP